MKNILKILLLLNGLLWAVSSQAVLELEITKGVEGAIPIAIIPFVNSGKPGASIDVAAIVATDLLRSGKFSPLAEDKLLAKPTSLDAVNYKLWRTASIDHLVIGQIHSRQSGEYELQFRLLDVFKGVQVLGYKFRANEQTLRRTIHHISDLIYQHVTGQKGAFNTTIAYVTVERKAKAAPVFRLQVADTDGHNSQTVLTSDEPIMSPAWSPDGSRLAYVSFENQRSEIYIQHLSDQQREKVSSQAGINGAPVWSPDGNKLALTLSKGSNTDIYILDLASKKLTQLTRHWAIDTEPGWTPDGSEIVFTSSRSGKPQIYKIGLFGGKAKRLTFEGNYNANPELSPDGKQLVFVQGNGRHFKIAIMDLETRFVQILTDGVLDESPSFAPNGSMILYASQSGNRGVLAAVSSDGRYKQKLVLSEGDVREPTWGPFRRQ
ncbi:MAG: Tol-Pal system beta propeller repeat protein TolB [Gammaproteobacteria bacterium]